MLLRYPNYRLHIIIINCELIFYILDHEAIFSFINPIEVCMDTINLVEKFKLLASIGHHVLLESLMVNMSNLQNSRESSSGIAMLMKMNYF